MLNGIALVKDLVDSKYAIGDLSLFSSSPYLVTVKHLIQFLTWEKLKQKSTGNENPQAMLDFICFGMFSYS